MIPAACAFAYMGVTPRSARPDATLADPRPQLPQHQPGPVRLLPVLQDGDQRPRRRDRRAVERVYESRALLTGSFVTNVQPAGLEVGAVRRARHFAVLALLAPA